MLTLPDHDTHLSDCNFLTRKLYRHCYTYVVRPMVWYGSGMLWYGGMYVVKRKCYACRDEDDWTVTTEGDTISSEPDNI